MVEGMQVGTARWRCRPPAVTSRGRQGAGCARPPVLFRDFGTSTPTSTVRGRAR
jgi:hypothetical protein